MTNTVPTLLVAVADRAAIVKVKGRANFTTSVSFKRLVTELTRRGLENVVLDLTECVTMDSTFLGVLAGTALRLSEAGAPNGVRRHPTDPARLRLLNPNQRVSDLLENLGVSDLFRTVHCEVPRPDRGYEATPDASPTKEELTRTCLEAHELLMDLNPQNIPKFKEVAQFLAEDLKGCTGPEGQPSETSAPEPAPAGGERS